MTIDLYYTPGSAPCATVRLAARAIGVELNLKPVDLMKGEHLTPEFLKINPQHTLPTLVDNGFILWESRAIITYLQNQYGKNDSLYPKDAKKRAVVDQRLYFDASSLYSELAGHYFPTVFYGATPDAKKVENIDKALKLFDTFLEKSEYAAGDNLTLADLSLASTISSLNAFRHNLSPYKNITKWFSRVQDTAPGFKKDNSNGLEILKKVLDGILDK